MRSGKSTKSGPVELAERSLTKRKRFVGTTVADDTVPVLDGDEPLLDGCGVGTQRGEKWVQYQVDWKLQAPHCRRLGLSGLDGLITLYEEYRALTDQRTRARHRQAGDRELGAGVDTLLPAHHARGARNR